MSHTITALLFVTLLAVGLVVAAPARASEDTPYDIRDRIAEIERQKLELVKTLALIYEARDDQTKAAEYTYQAFMLDATDEVLAAKLIDLMRKNERWTEMIAIYERLIEERPGQSQEYLLDMSTCYFKLAQSDKAFAVLDQYKREYADYVETYLKLATVYADAGSLDKAAGVLQEAAVHREFGKQYKVHWQLGIVYVELDKIEEAISAYEKALDLVEPGSDRNAINSRLIALYKQADKIEDVIQKRETEIDEIDAKLVKLYWAEAEKHEQAERFLEAIKLYRKIGALAPDSDKGKAAAAKIEELTPKVEE
ncbi:MAG: tetratricopeptide repeat protein [Verrucomicrobia bacterium]|nr:tetratricopeptide repeat protein [Verrucomicrobiota bacterium]